MSEEEQSKTQTLTETEIFAKQGKARENLQGGGN